MRSRVTDMDRPNGLAFSPDESILYVADSAASFGPDRPHHIRQFKVGAANKLSGGKVFAEINPGDVHQHKGIIANPNCTTAITLMALHPLHKAFGVTRIFASSYQAVSGTGAKAGTEPVQCRTCGGSGVRRFRG